MLEEITVLAASICTCIVVCDTQWGHLWNSESKFRASESLWKVNTWPFQLAGGLCVAMDKSVADVKIKKRMNDFQTYGCWWSGKVLPQCDYVRAAQKALLLSRRKRPLARYSLLYTKRKEPFSLSLPQKSQTKQGWDWRPKCDVTAWRKPVHSRMNEWHRQPLSSQSLSWSKYIHMELDSYIA